MTDTSGINNTIATNITTNGRGAITGAILASVLGSGGLVAWIATQYTPHVASLAALQTFTSSYASTVIRDDFSSGFGAPPLTYKWFSTCPGTPDNVAAIIQPPGSSPACWSAASDPNLADIREWGAACNAYDSDTEGSTFGADGAVTFGSAAFSSTRGVFSASSVGNNIVIAGAGAAGAPLSTTITGYTDASHVTLNAAASTTVTQANFNFGTDDTNAIKAAVAAASVSTSFNTLRIPANRICGMTANVPITASNVGFSGAQVVGWPRDPVGGPAPVTSGFEPLVGGITLFTVAPVSGASTPPVYGNRFLNVGFGLNNMQSVGIDMSGAQGPRIDAYFQEGAPGLYLHNYTATLGGYCGVQSGKFNVSAYQYAAASPPIIEQGLFSCNPSLNNWGQTQIFHNSQYGFSCLGCDNELFDTFRSQGIGSASASFYVGSNGGYAGNSIIIKHQSTNLPLYADTGTSANFSVLDTANATPAPSGSGTSHWYGLTNGNTDQNTPISYTPTIACQSGSGTFTGVSGQYIKNYKTYYVQVNFQISAIGSCANWITVSLPAAANGTLSGTGTGKDRTTSVAMSAEVAPGASTASLVGVSGLLVGTTNDYLTMNLTYTVP